MMLKELMKLKQLMKLKKFCNRRLQPLDPKIYTCPRLAYLLC